VEIPIERRVLPEKKEGRPKTQIPSSKPQDAAVSLTVRCGESEGRQTRQKKKLKIPLPSRMCILASSYNIHFGLKPLPFMAFIPPT
jgi:hypothetical protein